MAFPKFHGISLANGSWIEKFNVENLASDPQSSELTTAGRVWYNATAKVIKFTVFDTDGETVLVKTVSDVASAQAALDAAVAGLQSQITTNASAISQEVTDRESAVSAVQSELDATQAGAGLETDGSFAAPVGSNYLDSATSLKDAALSLDTAVKTTSDAVAGKVSKSGDSMTGNLAMQGNKVTGLSLPINPLDAATKSYVDSKIVGLTWKSPVRVVVATEADFSALSTAELVAGNMVAVVETANIYTWDGSSFGLPNTYAPGSAFTNYLDSNIYVVQEDATPGEYTLIQINGLSQVTAGIGLSKEGNTLSVNLGAGIAQLPTDEVGLDVRTASGLMLTEDGTTESTGTAAQLAIKLDGTTLSVGADGLRVSAATMATINGKASQTELDATQTGAGLETDGSYAANTGSNYIDAATSLKGADSLLDAAIKAEADRAIAAESSLNSRVDTLEAAAGAVDALKTQINGKRYTFKSTTPATTHTITHGLNAEFINYTIMVQDPVDSKWRNDIVPVEEIDFNSFRIDLTVACNVKVSVQDAAQLT